ncbi:MAG TPA: hypothetical protein DCW90_09205 [Lachnospiraceae bacterium]|nr:FliH/SctL family protein [uncultured Lachnoclostridium sp.]HAU85663.1 hypothetical protein [Lachnospiraceae bacterium]
MSNLIKGNYIRFSQSDCVIIDSNFPTEQFNPLSFTKVEEDKTLVEETETAIEAKEDSIPDLEEINHYAENIIMEARAEADKILESAKAEALEVMTKAREQGEEEGYQSGLSQIEEKKRQMDQELKVQLEKQQEEYERTIKQLEPQFADLTMKLVEKITGIVVEDKKDLIMYLLSTTLKPIRGPKQFLIRVSEEDAPIVSQHKEALTDLLSDDCTLEIFEDPTLNKNQCFIETEDRLLDVSLDVQLKNLSEHLKVLANA